MFLADRDRERERIIKVEIWRENMPIEKMEKSRLKRRD